MNKNTRHFLVGLAVLGVIVLSLFGRNLFSVAIVSGDITCLTSGTQETCVNTLSGEPLTSQSGSNGEIVLSLTNIGNSNKDLFKNAWSAQNSTVAKFFSQGTICASSGNYDNYIGITPDPAYDSFADLHTKSSPLTALQACGSNYYSYIKWSQESQFDNQLFLVSGTIVANNGVHGEQPIPFSTYGFCKLRYTSGTCKINIPEMYKQTGDTTFWVIHPTSMVIQAKYGGYDTSQTYCAQSGLEICQSQTLLTCSAQGGNFVPQGNVSGKCGVPLPAQINQTQNNNINYTTPNTINTTNSSQNPPVVSTLPPTWVIILSSVLAIALIISIIYYLKGRKR